MDAIKRITLTLLTTLLPFTLTAAVEDFMISPLELPSAEIAGDPMGALPRLEHDSYDWYKRHALICHTLSESEPEILLLGDSITHFWGPHNDGTPQRGLNAWEKTFSNYKVLNAGFGWDRVQNLRWRLENGEAPKKDPKLIILHIGTNNSSQTKNARQSTPEETAKAIYMLTEELLQRYPSTRILLFEIFPRDAKNSPTRQWIDATNKYFDKLPLDSRVTLISLYHVLTQPNGERIPSAYADRVHLSDKGYDIWARAIQRHLPPKKSIK